MKRFIALLVVTILLVSFVGVMTAFAGASVSGTGSVEAGKTYTYNVSVSCTGFDMFGNVSCCGIFSGSTVQFGDAAGAGATSNVSLSDTVSIKVTVASNAKPGDTGTIIVNGQLSTFDGENVGESGISSSKTATVVATPAATAKPVSKPKATIDPNATPKPTPELTEWELAASGVADMQSGGMVGVEITKSTQMPVSVLAALLEKQGVLEMNFGDYTCTIDGSFLEGVHEDIENIDLAMSMEVDEELSQTLDGMDAYQLHFSHEGQLPGKFTYTFKAEASSPGDTVYLYYYYDQAGVIEGKQSAAVDENGFVTFDIYHCSSYFVSDKIIEGATNNFSSQSEEQVLLEEELQESQDAQVLLEEQLQESQDAQESQEDDSQTMAATIAGPAGQAINISIAAFVVALFGVVILSVFVTMFLFKVGIFNTLRAQH